MHDIPLLWWLSRAQMRALIRLVRLAGQALLQQEPTVERVAQMAALLHLLRHLRRNLAAGGTAYATDGVLLLLSAEEVAVLLLTLLTLRDQDASPDMLDHLPPWPVRSQRRKANRLG